MSADVAIVGGGPVGLALALCLSRRGHSVVLFEAEATPHKEQRGAAFHPPTLEMLETLGITEKLLPLGVCVPVWQIRDREGLIAEFDLAQLAGETRYPFRFHLPQHMLSQQLIAALHKERNVLRMDHKVTRLEEGEDGVTLHFDHADGSSGSARTRFVVGADGAHSVVRRHAGIAFDGFSWPERFLVTNIAYPLETLGFSGTSYVSDPEKWAVIIRLAGEGGSPLWRVAFPTDPDLPTEQVLAPEAVQQRLHEVLPAHVAQYPVVYSSTYRVHQRVAATFRRGRYLLAGDAAHINNPLGGFGLNGGIHDAFCLADAFGEVLGGNGADTAPLDRYDRQRRTVAVEHVQAQSIRNKKQIEEKDPSARAQQASELRAIAADAQRSRAYLMDSSMLSSVRRAAEVA